jgi:predicted nuclease of predicted toxin-antitoxin system
VTVRFLADEDLDSDIINGLLSREPTIDVLDIKNVGLRGSKDSFLLELAFEQDRILITHDRRTMTRYFRERLAAGQSSPGIFIVPQRSAIGDIIESLLLVSTASKSEEWRNQIVYLPFR